MRLSSLQPGAKGFDCNTVVTRANAIRMKDAGKSFVIRYVRRTTAHDFDISSGEVATLMDAGLGLMLVQHVAAPGWQPTHDLGVKYGTTAAAEAAIAGYLIGAHLWCDLEGVMAHTPPGDVIGFCNEWYDVVHDAGYHPGLYVGDSCGLSADQLYHNLRFDSFWSAYNLNRDNYPAVRGVMLRQLPYPPPEKRVAGVTFEYDEDVVQADMKGSLPRLVIP